MVPKVDTHCELVKREGQEKPKASSTLSLKRVDSMEMPKSKKLLTSKSKVSKQQHALNDELQNPSLCHCKS